VDVAGGVLAADTRLPLTGPVLAVVAAASA
jgi:hypothetical protein